MTTLGAPSLNLRTGLGRFAKKGTYQAGGSPPANSVAPVITGTLQVGQVQSCSTGTWSNTPTGYTYQWFVNSLPVSGATANTYTCQTVDAGFGIYCAVTAANSNGSNTTNSNTRTPIIVAAPVNTVAPVASGNLWVGSVLSVTDGTWSIQPSAFSYQWQRNGVNIASAISATYTLVSADLAANVRCVVTGVNAGGSQAVNSNAIGPVALSATPAWSTSSGNTNSSALPTTFAVSLPATIAAGDLLITQVVVKNDNGDASCTMNTAGWTAFAGNPYGTGTIRNVLWWRIADGTEGGGTVSITGTGGTTVDAIMARTHRFTAANGFNATTPVIGISTLSGAATPLTLPSLTPTNTNQLAVICTTTAADQTVFGDIGAVTNGSWTQRAYATGTSGTGMNIGIQTSLTPGGVISGGSKVLSPTARWNCTGFILQPI